MSTGEPERAGGSRMVQGCLIGAVLLFVVLLAAMLLLAYSRFQDATATPQPPVAFGIPDAVAMTVRPLRTKLSGTLSAYG